MLTQTPTDRRRPTSAPLSLHPGPELMWRYVIGDPAARAAISSWRSRLPISICTPSDPIWSHEVTF